MLAKVIYIVFHFILVLPVQAMSLQQPTFSLQYTIVGSGAEIRLNDIPVINQETKGKTTSEKQVPDSIIDGKNTLMIKSFPLEADGNKYKEDAYIDVMIIVHEKDAPSSKGKPIMQIRLNPANPEDRLLDGSSKEYGGPPKVFSHSEEQTIAGRQVAIKSPFPRWAWQDGQLIEKSQKNFKSLLEKYKEVWDALNTGDMNRVHSLYDPAAKEFAQAYHYNGKQHGHRLMDTGGFINKQDWELGDLTQVLQTDEYMLDIYAQGFMARIIDKYSKSPIVYLNPKSELLSFQTFGFYQNKNGEWIMIR